MTRARRGLLVAVGIIVVLAGAFQPAVHGPAFVIQALAAERQPLYYQDPAGKPDYSPVPKKDAAGRDYVPVYEDSGDAGANAPSPAGPEAPAPTGGERRILYYRNPMG